MNAVAGALVLLGLLCSCTAIRTQDAAHSPIPGTVVLKNDNGLEVHVLPLGMIIQKFLVPDRSGQLQDVVLGFDILEPYQNGTSPYFGAVIGRVANRIANGEFELDGTTYHTSQNENTTTLHGGVDGWSRRVWDLVQLSPSALVGFLNSPDGDEGFPGTVNASVTYNLTNANEFIINFEATSDKATPINMAQHSYFNLNGAYSGSTVLNDVLTINGDYITPTDTRFIPNGTFEDVRGTPFDFTTPHTVGERIDQVTFPPPYGGYDTNYVLFGLTGEEALDSTFDCILFHGQAEHAVHIESPITGIALDVYTDSPGLQFYAGNQLLLETPGKGGVMYPQHGATVFETQDFPNFINTPDFPQCTLQPGSLYSTLDMWKFTVVDAPAPAPAALTHPTPAPLSQPAPVNAAG